MLAELGSEKAGRDYTKGCVVLPVWNRGQGTWQGILRRGRTLAQRMAWAWASSYCSNIGPGFPLIIIFALCPWYATVHHGAQTALLACVSL